MEVAIIDWKTFDSRVVLDDLYEHINAPKWVDFTVPIDLVDDDAWFCRPDCDHPKRVEDFFHDIERTPISNSKIRRLPRVSDIPPYHRSNSCRDATLKNRGINQPYGLSNKDTNYYKLVEDAENQDPNFSTPLLHKPKFGKGVIKSSADQKQASDANERTPPKLKSTLSARNLFSGADLLSKVSGFCTELKKLAIRAQDKECASNVVKQGHGNWVDENAGIVNGGEKEKKSLLEQRSEKSELATMSSSKGKLRRKKRNDDSENTPISVDTKNIKHLDAEDKLPIRTCPPTPQCFSANYGNTKSANIKPFRDRALNQERRGILQDPKQIEKDVVTEEKKSNQGGGEVAEKEARSLDVFWFLKPCTISS